MSKNSKSEDIQNGLNLELDEDVLNFAVSIKKMKETNKEDYIYLKGYIKGMYEIQNQK
ncbi:MAG: hypothetical protein E7E88_15175 [Clostridium perfringens]|uniref:hypothetical protein n=1 Tax=Veillonella sp. TaxID=1926307 RepID=UPI0029036DDA|nr:hypothetical protein [Veillonella sp.]MDU2094777.1 hypothetical protein [Clostridium perfringens]MDU2102685.1 hypothetical protein [Veillonella sp.]